MTADAGAAAPPPAAPRSSGHIRLTSHSGGHGAPAIRWGAPTAAERGPVVGTTTTRAHRNVIGTHSGSYGVYRALAVAAGALSPRAPGRPDQHRADRRDRPVSAVERSRQDRLPRPVGRDGGRGLRRRAGGGLRHPADHRRDQGAHQPARGGRGDREGPADGRTAACSLAGGAALVTKAAIEPVWYLPGVAQRFGCTRDRPAPRAVRGDRRHVPRARHALATSRCSCRPSAARPSTSSATCTTSPTRRWR